MHFRTAFADQYRVTFGAMAFANRSEVKRLILQIERDVLAQNQLRTPRVNCVWAGTLELRQPGTVLVNE